MAHLVVLPSGMQKWPMLREIAKLSVGEGGCHNLVDTSIYICVENKDCHICGGGNNFTLSDVSQVKLRSGRMGKLINKHDTLVLCKLLNTGISPDKATEVPLDKLEAFKHVYNACKHMVKVGYENVSFRHGELGKDGCLIPLPISNMTQEQRDVLREGQTTMLVRNDTDQGIVWKKVSISGDHVDELLNEPEAKERKLLVDKKSQNISDCEMELIEEKYLRGVKGEISPLGFKEPPAATGEEKIEISYIYGPNGSGKTYYGATYAHEWSKMFKDWPIYLFSRRDKDKVLDELPTLKRVEIDERLITEPLTMDNFGNSLVIFDDIDTIVNLKIRLAIQNLRDDIMETGRQKMIYVINTSHLGMNWKPTRTVLNEANSYTLFPRRGNYDQNFKILRDKMGLKKDVITLLIDKPNGLGYIGKWGWLTIYRDVPQYVIYELGCSLL